MNKAELVDAFGRVEERMRSSELREPVLPVELVFDSPEAFVTCSSKGARGLVIPASASSKQPPPIRLKALSISYGAVYVLEVDGTRREVRATMISCTSPAAEVQDLFAFFCSAFLENLPENPDDGQIEKSLELWADLFLRLERNGRASALGIAGELTFLYRTTNKAEAVRAWHSDAYGTFDFAFPAAGELFEVKTSGQAKRQHHISIDQISAFSSYEVYFASMLVRASDNGISLVELAEEISSELSDVEIRNDFWMKLLDSAGSDWPNISTFRFDVEDAARSLQCYAREDIPKPIIALPLPKGVSSVKFVADFSGCEAASPTML